MPKTTANSPPKAIEVASEDPEIIALQAMIKGLHHFNERNLSGRHLKVLMAVELCIKAARVNPRVIDIATFTQLKPEDFEAELRELVELRYLHEEYPTFGPLIYRYKLGSMGGTLLRKMMKKDSLPGLRTDPGLKSVK